MSLPETIFNLAVGLPDPLPPEPFTLLASWLKDAERARKTPNPNAIALATATPDGRPSVRMVLCKDLDPVSGSLTFFTNYTSRKAAELESNPRAACVFHWDHAERQARVEGAVARLPGPDSDAYFATRPLLSRLGAWASQQSQPLARRTDLLRQVEAAMSRLGLSWLEVASGRTGTAIPRPPTWGGYRLTAERIELWQGVAGRLHDRACWTRAAGAPGWTATRLQP